jgi:hypothetical protein
MADFCSLFVLLVMVTMVKKITDLDNWYACEILAPALMHYLRRNYRESV